MGIQLDWEIESEKTVSSSNAEDPIDRRRRRRGYMVVLLILLVLGGLVAGGVAFVVEQVNAINEQIETNLRDTVRAEVAALRIGNWESYASVQRSASQDWLRHQRSVFEDYQEKLRTSDDTRLVGEILDVEIDEPRARVHVQEIIDGVPYTRVWFYWFYEEDTNGDGEIDLVGWRHVPPDYTFWGESAQYDGQYVDVAYRMVDEPFASALGDSLDSWVATACEAFTCDGLPSIRVQVAPDEAGRTDWAANDLSPDWTMSVASPYATRARTDMPFSPQIQMDIATLLAERLVRYQLEGQRMLNTSDAAYIESAAVKWLVGRYTRVDTGSYLFESLAANYSPQAVGTLLANVTPDSGISVITSVVGVPLNEAELNWQDFFTWRLDLEQRLAEMGVRGNFMSLYATDDPGVAELAETRFREGPQPGDLAVVSAGATSPSESGQPQVVATVQNQSEPDAPTYQVLFRLVDNRWVRAS